MVGTQTCAMGLTVNGNNAAKRVGWIEVVPERCLVFPYHGKDSFLGSIFELGIVKANLAGC